MPEVIEEATAQPCKIQRFIFLLIVSCSVVHFVYDATNTSSSTYNNNLFTIHKDSNSGHYHDIEEINCKNACHHKRQQEVGEQNSKSSDALLELDKVLKLVLTEKENVIAKLKLDYGDENFNNIFTTEDSFRKMLKPSVDKSYNRMKTKLMLKILKVQMNVIQENEMKHSYFKKKNKNACNCDTHQSTIEVKNRRKLQQQRQQGKSDNSQETPKTTMIQDYDFDPSDPTSYYTKFVFATGGHSAAAGHGDFYEESYTRILEHRVRSVFGAIGIQFVGRQYAMGGTASGTEVALCVDSIFGTDIDALSWDFGMTDGREYYMFLLYAYHAGMQRQMNKHSSSINTAFFGFNLGGNGYEPRTMMLEKLAKAGMITFYHDKDVWKDVLDNHIPDTLGLSDGQIKSMPKYLKMLKCGDKIEDGEPGCKGAKFNETVCTERTAKTSWHPGWKIHALQGNFMALFFIELLINSINELTTLVEQSKSEMQGAKAESSSTSFELRQQLFNRLLGEEKNLHKNFTAQDMDIKFKEDFVERIFEQPADFEPSRMKDKIIDDIFRSRSFCHTALTPSDIRYRGILTEQLDQIGYSNFYQGISQKEADETNKVHSNETSAIRIVQEYRDERDVCPIKLHIDHKDFFYVHNNEGWTSLHLPNEMEKVYYRDALQKAKSEHLIFICPTVCDWDRCPKGNVNTAELLAENHQDHVSIVINDVPVTKYSKMAKCFLLQHEATESQKQEKQPYDYYWKSNALKNVAAAPDVDYSSYMNYEIKIKVNQPDAYIRIGSFIIV